MTEEKRGKEPELMELHNCVYLSAEEFIFLASGAGMEELTCVLRKPMKEMTDEILHQTLFSLCSRGVIRVERDSDESYFQVEEPVRSMFQTMLAGSRRVIAYRGSAKEPAFWGYLGDSCVILQVSDHDENALRLFSMDVEDLNIWLIQENYVPAGGSVQKLLAGSEEMKEIVLRAPEITLQSFSLEMETKYGVLKSPASRSSKSNFLEEE